MLSLGLAQSLNSSLEMVLVVAKLDQVLCDMSLSSLGSPIMGTWVASLAALQHQQGCELLIYTWTQGLPETASLLLPMAGPTIRPPMPL